MNAICNKLKKINQYMIIKVLTQEEKKNNATAAVCDAVTGNARYRSEGSRLIGQDIN